MVPPPLPPVLLILSYVPDECHASRTIVGPMSGSAVIIAASAAFAPA